MKNIFFLTALLTTIAINSQSLGYNDLGVLFSNEDLNGTSRFRSMSGAFGALGGDLSATQINPAGGAIFLKSEFSASFSSRNQIISSNYYNTTTTSENDYSNFSQAGFVLVFNTGNSIWSKTAIGVNYSVTKDFQNEWAAEGNSNYPTFIYDNNYTDDGNDTNDILYLNSDGQSFRNSTDGEKEEYTFFISSQYNDKLFFGVSLKTQDLGFYQSVALRERNNDGNGNTLNGSLTESLATIGSGFTLGMGVISKLNDNVRLGLSYQSPTWYALTEEFQDSDGYTSGFDYKMQTPSKLNGSAAYIFAKNGLISLDYTIKNYSNIRLKPTNIRLKPTLDFENENSIFRRQLKTTSELRVGTEWRFNRLSLRGGLNYKENPYKDAISSDHIKGYSLGLGYSFGNTKIDVSFEDANHTDVYNFYPEYNEINSTELDLNNKVITATLTFNI